MGKVLGWVQKAEAPVLVHCRGGTSSTGAVVAALLLCADVSEELIVRDFTLSGGAEEDLMKKALVGLQ